jgi:hypothetical protein
MQKKSVHVIWVFVFSMLFSTAYACEGAKVSDKLLALESQRLLKNPKAFAHGWQDGEIKLAFEQLASANDACIANMKLTIPQRDLDEVNAHLDQNPAKRILLGAQGYSVPSTTTVTVPYQFALVGEDVLARNEGNKALNDLNSSLQFIYQQLTQLRAELANDARNAEDWPATIVSTWKNQCLQEFVLLNEVNTACSCKIDKLSAIYTGRQMELIEDLQSHPYSATSPALIRFREVSKQINTSCALSPA